MNKNNNGIKTTAHSSDRCQYYIAFAPKFRIKTDIWEVERRYSRNVKKIM